MRVGLSSGLPRRVCPISWSGESPIRRILWMQTALNHSDGVAMFCSRSALASVAVAMAAIAAALVINGGALRPHPADLTAPDTPTPQAPWLFNGDYSTGDFSQWPLMATKFYGTPTRMLPGSGYIPA